jgi:hypothetical protein
MPSGAISCEADHYPDNSCITENTAFRDILNLMRGIVETTFKFVDKKAIQLGKLERVS